MDTITDLQSYIQELETAHGVSEMLLQLSRDLYQARNPQEIRQVLERLSSQQADSLVSLLYVDVNAHTREAEWLEIVTTTLVDDGQMPFPVGTRVYLPDMPVPPFWLNEPEHPQLIEDIEADSRLDEVNRSFFRPGGGRAAVLIPLLQAGEWIGLVVFSWGRPRTFSSTEMAIYQALSVLVAPIVANHRLMANLEAMVVDKTREFREAKQLLQLVLDSIPVRVLWKDRESRYLGCNRLVAQDAGVHSPEQMIGKTDYEFFPDQAELYRSDDRSIMESGKSRVNYEEPQTTPDGATIWLRTSKVPLRNADGDVIGVLGTYDDITAQKQAQVERERLQQEIIEAQREALKDLSTPIIPITDQIIVMPLVGSIDTARARDITRLLLSGITTYRAKIVIVDITGVPIVDSGVADHLNKTIQAARLKGAKTIITGVSDAVAETIVDLGIDWSAIETLSDLQTGLKAALEALGMSICWN